MIDKIASAIGRFCYKFRIVLSILGVVIFAVVIYTESLATISYTNEAQMDPILDEFPEDTLLIVYSSENEDEVVSIVSGLAENDSCIAEVQGYYNTLGMELTPSGMAEMIASYGIEGMDEMYIDLLYYVHENGTENVGSMTGKQFSDFLTSEEFLGSSMVSSMMDESMQSMLDQYGSLLPILLGSTTEYTPSELAGKFEGLSGIGDLADSFDENTITLLYLLYWSQQADLSEVTMTLYDFFNFICDDIATDDLFAPMITEEYAAELGDYQETMESGKAQLQGEVYSRVVLTITYVPESDEIYEFYDSLNAKLTEADVEYYLVGSTAMSYELSQTFYSEYMLISILTAVVIFIVVCLTFRKFSVSAFLVCIIECAVFITMTVMAIMNSAMYFIALMMVQCILMGSMVDYGILLSSYYKELRGTYSKKDVLPEVMKRSIKAIFTSALIMICVCFILSFTVSGAIGSILRILGIGCLSALILILFFLPSLLSVSDKLLTKGWKDIKPFREARKASKASKASKNGNAAPAEDAAEAEASCSAEPAAADAAEEDGDKAPASSGDAPAPQET